MIVTWSFLGIILIIGFIFLGIKMSESFKHGDIKIFFLALYTITLITFINIGISFYFYAKTAKKKGQKGLRGLQGKVGDKGDSGYCEDNCKVNSLKLLLIDKIRDEDDTLKNVEQRVCRFFNFTDLNKDKLQEIENLTLTEYKYIKENIDDDIEDSFTLFIDGIKKLTVDGSKKNEGDTINDLTLNYSDSDSDIITLQYIDKAC